MRNPTEGVLQAAIMTWARTLIPKHPELRWLHHVPNGGERSGREAMNLQAQGVTPGVVDLDLPVSRIAPDGTVYCGLKPELKRPGGKCEAPSKEQAEYMEFCTGQGYLCFISNDFAEIKRRILEYLSWEPFRK